MFQKVVAKSKDILWLKVEAPILGRHELARIEFSKWEHRQEKARKETK